ncbi:ethionine resistance protein [Coemansia sp. Benny D115]|nr:ethionine resistance protein [Coemansia sp. Benny D115]
MPRNQLVSLEDTLSESAHLLVSNSTNTLTTPDAPDTIENKYLAADSVPASVILKKEARLLTITSVPVILTYLLQYSFSFINLLVLGHIGANELAAAALVNMTLVVAVYSPAIGLASALDTFCSTAFTASRDKTLVGFHLQRGLIAVTVLFLAIAPVLWKAETVFIWLRQEPQVSRLCGRLMQIQLLGAPAWMYFECIKRFLQAQGIMHASTVILIVLLPIHLAANFVLVWSPSLGLGYLGTAVANALVNLLMLVGILFYVWRGRARETWGGWTMQAVRSMPQYFRLALPSMVMICAEWWILDLLVLAASYLGSTTLAAQSIIVNTCTLTYQVADGLSVAVCNRVGNLIGQARPRRARLSAWLGISVATTVGLLTLLAALCVGNWWGLVYSDDPRIIARVALIMPACAVFQMFDAVNSVGSGVLRSLGKQDSGALINFTAYYVLGFPLGLFLTYGRLHVGVLGLWCGICAGVALAVLLQICICLATRWDDEVRRCIARVSKDQDTLDCSTPSGSESGDEAGDRDGGDDRAHREGRYGSV